MQRLQTCRKYLSERPVIKVSTALAIVVVVLALVSILGVNDSLAQTIQPGANNSLDPIVEIFRDSAKKWEQTLSQFALQLFWLLVGIEFTFAAIMLAFRGADFSEWLSTLVQQILFIGFFLALLTHSAEWARAIIDSFRQAAVAAAQESGVSTGLAPSNVLDTGLQIALKFVASTARSKFAPKLPHTLKQTCFG